MQFLSRLSKGVAMVCLAGSLTLVQAELKLAIVESDSNELYKTIRKTALEVLAKGGLNEGKQFTLSKWSVGNDAEKAKAALQEAVKLSPDVILASGTIVAKAAHDLYLNDAKLKFVYAGVTDAVGLGLVSAIGAAPNANFTGVSFPVPVKARLKFIKNLVPTVKTIGLVYADMPQSLSYKAWLEEALQDPEFAGIKIVYKSVPLITGEGGALKMVAAAKPLLQSIEGQVDLFMSPNDQMGVNAAFPKAVMETVKKPLIGLGMNDVMQSLGAVAVIYPSFQSLGNQAGAMLLKVLNGTAVSAIPSEWVKETGIALDLKKCQAAGITPSMGLIKLAGTNIIK